MEKKQIILDCAAAEEAAKRAFSYGFEAESENATDMFFGIGTILGYLASTKENFDVIKILDDLKKGYRQWE